MSAIPESSVGAACALLSAGTWAVISLLVRRLAGTFNSATVNAIRATAGGVLLLAWVLATAGTAPFRGITAYDLLLLISSVILAGCLGDTVFFESTRFLGLARAMTASMTYPLLAALLAAPLLGEPVTPALLLGSVLTLGGLAIIVGTRQADSGAPNRLWLGLGTATLASAAWAVSAIMLKPALSAVDSTTAQAIRLPVTGLVLLATPWAWGALGAVRAAAPDTGKILALLAALTAVSSVLFVMGIKHAGVGVATVLSATSPMFAIPLGALYLGERMTVTAALGTALTVAGIAVLNF
jgi:drug/metabolite transporter (DMT)-like permease